MRHVEIYIYTAQRTKDTKALYVVVSQEDYVGQKKWFQYSFPMCRKHKKKIKSKIENSCLFLRLMKIIWHEIQLK